MKAALVTNEGQRWRRGDHWGNKQGIRTWGGGREAEVWEAPGQT